MSLSSPEESSLEKALQEITPHDLEIWDGWVDFESDPALFTDLLKRLGVPNIIARDIFTLDKASLAALPQPAYGLILIFEDVSDFDDTVDQPAPPEDLWFANQSREKGCASFAILNILMNLDIDLSPQLADFKKRTLGLSSPLRGYVFNHETFIRTAHNAFIRRLDFFDSDARLMEDVTDADANTKAEKKASAKFTKKRSKGVGKGNREARIDDTQYHYLAYISAFGAVWELDSIKSKPVKIGLQDESVSDWTALAQPRIMSRMANEGQYHLLALCETDQHIGNSKILASLASIAYLCDKLAEDQLFQSLILINPPSLDMTDRNALQSYDLTPEDVRKASCPNDIVIECNAQGFDAEAGSKIFERLEGELQAAMTECRSRANRALAEKEEIDKRKDDFTPAIHYWIKTLVEKDALQDLAKTFTNTK